MKKNSGHIAFAMALSGITSATLGHYADFWIIGYASAIMFALIANIIFNSDV